MDATPAKTIHIRYFALLREQRGVPEETVKTKAPTALELYQQLKTMYSFSLASHSIKVAVNDSFEPIDTVLQDLDTVVFIPPVAGG